MTTNKDAEMMLSDQPSSIVDFRLGSIRYIVCFSVTENSITLNRAIKRRVDANSSEFSYLEHPLEHK